MDIFLSEVSNKSSSFTFQSLPERIKTKFGTKYQNYDIISKGTVKIPRGLEAETISWDGTFYGKSKRNEVMIREWTSPAECVKEQASLLCFWSHLRYCRLCCTCGERPEQERRWRLWWQCPSGGTRGWAVW